MTDESLINSIMRSMEEDARARREREFKFWGDQLEKVPADFELKLAAGLVADLELQPVRWLTLGLDLLHSSKGTVAIQHMDEKPPVFFDSYLPYPVFQMGTEIFLKGMWLCQFENCRHIHQNAYLDGDTRRSYAKRLSNELGHDLLKIIDANRKIPEYERDPQSMRFLKIVEGIVRSFYFPLYQADRRASQWANSRYPKRFYDDAAKQGSADAFQSYPQQWLIIRLFQTMESRIEELWRITEGIATRTRSGD